MAIYPGDIDSRRTDSKACAIVHYQIDSNCWDYKPMTGHDVGTDCELELSEDGEWKGKKIEVQIKGTAHIDGYKIDDGSTISLPMEKKTIRYGLSKTLPYIVFVVDVREEKVYYIELHEYFLRDSSLFDVLDKDTKRMNIHIPIKNCLKHQDSYLTKIAKNVYVGGPTRNLRLAQ